MQLPYSETIDIIYLARLFDKKSESYKLFWFLAIVDKVSDGKSYLTYDEDVYKRQESGKSDKPCKTHKKYDDCRYGKSIGKMCIRDRKGWMGVEWNLKEIFIKNC